MNRFWISIIDPILDRVRPKYIVEVGAEKGYNTKNILEYCQKNSAHLTVIDPLPQFDLIKCKSKYGDKFEMYMDSSLKILPLLDDYDAVLIDGDHNYYTLYNELKIIETTFKNKKFPLVMIHDIGWPYARRDRYHNPENIPKNFLHPHKKSGMKPGQSELSDNGGFNPKFYNAVYENTPQNGVLTAIEDFITESTEDFSFIKLEGFNGLGILFSKDLELENFIESVIQHSDMISLIERDRIKLCTEFSEKEEDLMNLINDYQDKINHLLIELESKDSELLKLHNDLNNKTVELKRLEDNSELFESQLNLYKNLAGKENNYTKQLDEKQKQLKKLSSEASSLNRNIYEMEYANNYRRSVVNRITSVFPGLYFLSKIFKSGTKNALLNRKAYKIIKKNNLLDIGYYLKNNKDIRLSGRDPIIHYIFHGFKEHRKPNDTFDGEYYLQKYEDVKKSQLNPLVHYALYGMKEGRKTFEDINTHKKGKKENKKEGIVKIYEKFQIIQFTPETAKNPYYTMIGDKLKSEGIDFKYCDDLEKINVLLKNKPTIVHLHQLETYYHTKNKKETLKKANQLLFQLRNIKAHRGKLVYTMHNPLAHDRKYQDVDEMVNNELYALVDNIIVLGQSAKEFLIKEQNVMNPIYVVHHPSFKEFYGGVPDKTRVREELGLPGDALIFGNIGHIKPYKGLEFIIEAFNKFSDSQNLPQQPILCIVGTSPNERYIEKLKEEYADDNILIIDKLLSNTELIEYVSALDYSVFAFKDIWASGTVTLSISYGTPVIVPDIGCMDDYVQHLNNGLIYHPNDLNNLCLTLKLAADLEYYDHLQYMCTAYSDDHDVYNSTKELLAIYKKILNIN